MNVCANAPTNHFFSHTQFVYLLFVYEYVSVNEFDEQVSVVVNDALHGHGTLISIENRIE